MNFGEFYDKSKLEGIDLILSTGDLKSEYLEFLVTMSRADVFYIHGNHDSCYENKSSQDGHIHKNYGNFVREQKIGNTTVINAFENI